MTKQQENVLAAIKQQISRKRPWLPLSVLDSYDGRTINALQARGAIEIDLEYGVRPVKDWTPTFTDHGCGCGWSDCPDRAGY